MPATLADVTEVSSSSSSQQGPPATIEFYLGGKRLVRYNRMARSGDADAAVLGKGGFGCVYRYAIDASFTPPSSMDLALSLRSATSRRHASILESASHNDSHSNSEDGTPTKAFTKPPSLVAVKLCRTPCSGSFDELQKTSLIDKKTRRAETQDDDKSHVRIVRGEGRIFQYLQDALSVSDRTNDPPLVKLLANLSPTGSSRNSHLDSMDMSLDDEDGPPTRLLVFEKLIELDAERTPQGWTKSRKTWSLDRVEKVAFEVIQGLQFLHEHNVTHGDLKPSNLMLDPRTGVVKIIDLGASRRFVHLSNRERNNRNAVEEQDQHALSRGRAPTRLAPELCEGLGSLTGSPYYMAPEILLQATRYVDVSGRTRSVLEDYEYDYPSFLPREQWSMYQIGLSDLRRGWGIRADIWSWACTVQALLLKTVEESKRPSSSIISPYDFSFSRHRDEMIDPLYEKAAGEDDVPRFHQWCRLLPLLIVRIALEPVPLIAQADACSPALRSALKASLRHQDLRPTADDIQRSLETLKSSSARRSSTGFDTSSPKVSRPPSSLQTPRRPSQTLAAITSEASASPQSAASDLGSSNYATPPLSQGASSVSTPQHTCETGRRSRELRTPDPDRKVRFETSSTDSALFGPTSSQHEPSVEVHSEDGDSIPKGFELVSPTRSPRPRTTTLGGPTRPVTANATLQTSRSLFKSTLSPQGNLELLGKKAISRLSTSASFGQDRKIPRPGTSPSIPSDSSGRRPLLGSTSPYQLGTNVMLNTGNSSTISGQNGNTLFPPTSGGLNISCPLEGMRSLSLGSPINSFGRHEGARSVPSSPMAHIRGESMPLFGYEHQPGTPVRMPPPVAITPTTRANDQDIGSSPRCSMGELKGAKQNSLMATLKEKQVRWKQSSRKLMGRRESRSAQGSGETFGSRFGDDGWVHTSEPGTLGNEEVQQSSGSSLMMMMDSGAASSSNTGSPTRRSSKKEGEEGSASKPLLRRLLGSTWSTSS